MFKEKKLILLLLSLVTAILITGCSGDTSIVELTKDVDGPSQVIVGEESDEFTVTGKTGSTYYWEVKELSGENLGYFTNQTGSKTRFVASTDALEKDTIEIRALISNEPQEWIEIEVLGSKHENKFYKGGFHSIVATKDSSLTSDYKGYLAGGYIKDVGDLEPSPYIVKADNRGLMIHEKEYEGDGRFYDIEDIVLTGVGDRYYVIGYRRLNRDYFEPYIAKLNKKFEKVEQYTYPKPIYGDSFLKGAIGIEENVSMGITHIVAAGSYQVESGEVVPYLAKVDVETNEMETKIIPGIDGSYSSLSAIAETSQGYLAVGESDYAGTNRAFIISLDSELTQTGIVDIQDSQRLHQIKKVGDNRFVVVGEDGYVGIVDSKGSILTKLNIDSNLSFRDILVDNGDIILVGQDRSSQEGVVYKVDESTNNATLLGSYGNYLHAITKSTDGYYLLAGTSIDFYNYAVKIDPDTGQLVDRQ
ncbi:hypothetical protein [Orenia marismortui]|uniref:Uncharacterized protein n=1 Tax=Orenia marismortui TaxID=46469 RepID=A0A4R8H2T2_9FIRM|nr:hypothetical protein [Orenia marismortui]TDX52920.1 hypothetical protein C7959_10445 [Orenia marismortui]